jgi:hypothetical protein
LRSLGSGTITFLNCVLDTVDLGSFTGCITLEGTFKYNDANFNAPNAKFNIQTTDNTIVSVISQPETTTNAISHPGCSTFYDGYTPCDGVTPSAISCENETGYIQYSCLLPNLSNGNYETYNSKTCPTEGPMINNILTCNVEPTICPVPQTFNITYIETTSPLSYQETSIIQNQNDDIQTIIKQSEYFTGGQDCPPSNIYIKVGNDFTVDDVGNSQLKITTTRKYTRNGVIGNRSPRINTTTMNVAETENVYIKILEYGDSIGESNVSPNTHDGHLNINHVQYGTYLEYLKVQFELKVNDVIQPNTGFTKTYNLEHRVTNQIKEFKWDSPQDGVTVTNSSWDSPKDILTITDTTITELKISAQVGVYTTQGPGVSITSITDEVRFTEGFVSSSNPFSVPAPTLGQGMTAAPTAAPTASPTLSPQIIGLGVPFKSYDDGKSNIYFSNLTVSGFNGLTGSHVIKLAITGGPEKTITLIIP